jgi:hypothetical protein
LFTDEFTCIQDFLAGLDRLWAALGHPEYPLRKCLAMGATAVRLRRFYAEAPAIENELEPDVSVGKSRLPLWARLLVRNEHTLRHRTTWRRVGPAQVAAKLNILAVGVPVRARNDGTIVKAAPRKTRMALTWRVDSVLGDRMEHLIANQIRAALEDDRRFTLQYPQRAKAC